MKLALFAGVFGYGCGLSFGGGMLIFKFSTFFFLFVMTGVTSDELGFKLVTGVVVSFSFIDW